MAEGPGCLLRVLLLVCSISVSRAGEYCTTASRWSGVAITYCTYGCCGSTLDQYCCSPAVGLIVGGVFAGIAGVCIIVAVICVCIKNQSSTGRVVSRPVVHPASNVTVVSTGHTQAANGYGQPMGVQPMPPQPYGVNQGVPQAYSYSNPAYPPTQQPPPPGPSDPFAVNAFPSKS